MASPALAQSVRVSQSIVYYDIAGQSAPEIAASIIRNAPENTEDFVGATAYDYSWKYQFRQSDDETGASACAVFNASVRITIKLTLPRHRTIDKAPPDVVTLWENYAEALKRHELQHAAEFIDLGSRLPTALDSVRTPDCSTIEATANAVGTQYVDLAQSRADKFDALTRHGMNQGASFPGL